MTTKRYWPPFHRRRVDYSQWGICGYRHCAKPVPPGPKGPELYCSTGGRVCYHKEWHERHKALGVPS